MSKRNINNSLIANYEVSKKALGKVDGAKTYNFKDDQGSVIKRNRLPIKPEYNSTNKMEI
jgi:hypothetical protein